MASIKESEQEKIEKAKFLDSIEKNIANLTKGDYKLAVAATTFLMANVGKTTDGKLIKQIYSHIFVNGQPVSQQVKAQGYLNNHRKKK